MSQYPLVFDIKRGALDDGPGIRTVVFMKGCPLSCVWCHNPESINPYKEISFKNKRCIGCGKCEKVCVQNAICIDSIKRIDRDRCNNCAVCVTECNSLALEEIGKYYDTDELAEILKKDILFFDTSAGGVTFSGGEPMMHMDYVGSVMRKLKSDNIHIAVETCGYFDMTAFREKIAPYVDLIFFDLKLIDSEEHKKYTGRDNKIILENFSWLIKKSGLNITAVVPLIPSITSNKENLAGIKEFMRDVGCENYKFLEYNRFGEFKKVL